uniref:Uncharacterized protein LOC114341735 n=1 Tax=Diabrotica virgifera virgifera TaxID=50390 RepID=A0A6P7GX13_DIAVI
MYIIRTSFASFAKNIACKFSLIKLKVSMGTGLFCVVILFMIGYGYCSKEWGTDYVEVTEPPITQNYYFSKEGESYYEALHTCTEKSMQLLSIDSAKKNRELANIMKDSGKRH